jgi:hypothetical protein
MRMARPDTNGKISIRLTPTDGVPRDRGRAGTGEFSDPEFLARALDEATPVEVREGETQTLNLTLTAIR